ncbi:S-layer homology domain-containing protein [Brevibacillus composti]|uniref:S-layer homology domain-containing protein n=1 Tax=Brevibacillus composti TaxID=2796470 RepID=A0A7T5EKH3_9BACL|nr:S-layer homology domain-containing protein [Brevibacillus composti]QQE74273.1 S-layer homology domain-containing protein [Brevibacillus composti]QUO41355.1 S-layer homology domain-containing protein [Brevibacillus composti]
MNQLKKLLPIMLISVMFLTGTVVAGTKTTLAAAPKAGQQTDYQNHQYKDVIQYAIQNKLMWLFPDGNFRPEQPITQADLVSGLVNAKGLTQGKELSEFPANHWAMVYYERALKDGVLDGVPVNPNKVINREEASLLMYNAWKSTSIGYLKTRQVYSDAAVDSGWLPKKEGKFVNGVSTTAYDGFGTVSRGEEAYALFLLHQYMNDIKVGENIALQFHNSLKVSGGVLKGRIPVVSGKNIRLLIRFNNDTVTSYYSGDFTVNTSAVKYMSFTVKNSGQSKAIAAYNYDELPHLVRKNTR